MNLFKQDMIMLSNYCGCDPMSIPISFPLRNRSGTSIMSLHNLFYTLAT